MCTGCSGLCALAWVSSNGIYGYVKVVMDVCTIDPAESRGLLTSLGFPHIYWYILTSWYQREAEERSGSSW